MEEATCKGCVRKQQRRKSVGVPSRDLEIVPNNLQMKTQGFEEGNGIDMNKSGLVIIIVIILLDIY